ncbi:unnamed protein product [Rotaria magnacalcarata]|uniref:J domain-containing protein n=2 Tax=Rotaria magnacalcarata TaxID=392030 RepID=A0A816QFZ5_9BILA|nr:unnamed protein product [Rotaria magnacalcarata]CAF4103575.1 unnamed protein product [Rotaria magnacalcarata]
MATVQRKTPYEILDVPKDISYSKLRIIYRKKIHEHLQKKISVSDFRLICRAYETLSDSTKRKLYDTRQEWVFELRIDKYTAQQLASEPALIDDLTERLRNATLAELNAQDPSTGHTTLYCAARAGNIEAVLFLIEQGAEPDLSQRGKRTALHAAAYYGHADVVRCLLENGANYRVKDQNNNTAEDQAYNDDVTKVFIELKQSAYIRAAANELDWFLKNGLTVHQDAEYFSHRETLLHCASKKEFYELVRWLVERFEANLDLVDLNGNTPLHLAAYSGHIKIVDYLLNRGCDPTVKNRWGTTAEDEGNKYGNSITDLFKSMRERDMFEMARTGAMWWFDYYFNNDSKDLSDSNGVSLLYYACRYGQYAVVKWLLEHGANVNIEVKHKPNHTPLNVAKFRGHALVVELLLEHGADVDIEHDFGASVFEDEISKEVNRDAAVKTKNILLKYHHHLIDHKLIDIYVYESDGTDDEPILKTKLGLSSTYQDLSRELSTVSGNFKNSYFSIAGRALFFETKDTSIISAVGRSRYTNSKFIDTPICLTRHKTQSNQSTSHALIHQEPTLNLRNIRKKLISDGKIKLFTSKVPLMKKRDIQIENLVFSFSENSSDSDIELKITTIFTPDPEIVDIPGCICLFQTEINSNSTNSSCFQLPLVSMIDKPKARLYTLAQPTPFWFSSSVRRARLPLIGGIHAFVLHFDIIPKQLTLPADVFIAATLEKPLISRDKPIPCKCLILRKHNSNMFPHVAYHGTTINVIQSILNDGLVLPGTVTTNGKRINPPKSHIAREKTAFGVSDFASAIFLSPSVYYSADPTYAKTFSYGDRILVPVLECSVKSQCYSTNRCTVPTYRKHKGDDMETIEWRVKDPQNIEINAILFITKINSIDAAKMERIIKAFILLKMREGRTVLE